MPPATIASKPLARERALELRIVFEESVVVLDDLVEVLDAIDAALRHLQDQILRSAGPTALGPVVMDAVRMRVREARRRSVAVTGIGAGSLVVTAVVAATGAWILKNTLGESVKAAWLSSEVHEDLVNWLSAKLNDACRDPTIVAHSIREWCRKRLPRVEVRDVDPSERLTIRVKPRPEVPPPRGAA